MNESINNGKMMCLCTWNAWAWGFIGGSIAECLMLRSGWSCFTTLGVCAGTALVVASVCIVAYASKGEKRR